MAQRRKVPEGELCAVCCDKATGYHYGVASCNGCKTFFRRTIVSEHVFVCQYNGNCDINKNVRCACRHCRFNKCLAVGMDSNAIQNDRDRIGPTKKLKLIKNESTDDDNLDSSPGNENSEAERIMRDLNGIEDLCNILRTKVFPEHNTARETLKAPSLVYQASSLLTDQYTKYKEHYPASMNDVQMWNIRELKLCLEWVKTFPEFTALHLDDQFSLVHNFAFAFNILNRVYYSRDSGPDKIEYPNGAYILRQPQEQVRIPGCRSIYHRQMDEIMIPFRKLIITKPEFAAFKTILLFNPDASDLSVHAKLSVEVAREKFVQALFAHMISKFGIHGGGMRFGKLLLMTSSIQQIIAQNDENMQVMEVFGHFWRIDQFVKELCMKNYNERHQNDEQKEQE
uniref:Nuclear receptor domain-containing protein n=1 Tax=Strongyloides stercoralis TaxID=6248 RepID=A0A0K0ESV6_STRER